MRGFSREQEVQDLSEEARRKPRLAGLADLPAIDRLTTCAYQDYEPLLGGPPAPLTEDYRARVESGEVWLLGDERDEPVALLVLEDAGDRLVIFSVAVAPDQQGKGIGRHLLDFAQATAARRGMGTLALYTNVKMKRNIRIYREHGFREIGRRPHPARPGWFVVDMEKPVMAAKEQG